MFNKFLLTGVGFPINIFNDLTMVLDKAIYGLVKTSYEVFTYLADATILDDTIVKNITVRVYTLLGILMVFVLAFNLLTYIVDPDKIADKKVGASTFIKDVVIALAIITISPMMFNKLYALQSTIITSGVLENLILGGSPSSDAPSRDTYNTSRYNSLSDYYIKNGANSMVASVYVAFLYPKDEFDFTALDCTDDPLKDPQFEMYCDVYANVKEGASINGFKQFINNDDYNFTPFLTTVAGIVLLFFMFSFCVNLAKRVGKMAIIQLMAPIPVTLELLPNKKGLRDNWIKTLVKVYLEVFFYLLVMYLIVFLISLIPRTVANIFAAAAPGQGLGIVKLLCVVFLIFGLLKFGKEAPQLIFDLLGVKGSGTIAEAAKRAKSALTIGGFTGGLVGSTVGNAIRNFNNTEGSTGQRIRSSLAGAGSTAARNLWGARNVHNLRDAANLRQNVNQTVATNRTSRAEYRRFHGGTLRGVISGHINDFGANMSDRIDTFTHGNRATQGSSELALLERISQSTSPARINTANDAQYREYSQRYNNLRTTEFLNDFRAWKTLYNNPNGTEEDYIKWMKTDPDGALDRDRHAALIDAKEIMDKRKDQMQSINKNNLLQAAQELRVISELNPQLKNIVDVNGKKLFDVAQFDRLVNSEGQLLDSDGHVINEDTPKEKEQEAINKLQKIIDDFNKNIAVEKGNIQVRNAEARIRDEYRRNRHNNGSDNNNNNNNGTN